MTATAIFIAATMCLQGGEQVDMSRYVAPTASVYASTGDWPVRDLLPGYEDQKVSFTREQSHGLISFASRSCARPFEFNIEVCRWRRRTDACGGMECEAMCCGETVVPTGIR
jgi:hypothetical protein